MSTETRDLAKRAIVGPTERSVRERLAKGQSVSDIAEKMRLDEKHLSAWVKANPVVTPAVATAPVEQDAAAAKPAAAKKETDAQRVARERAEKVLAEKHQQAVTLHLEKGMHVAAIAREVGISQASVREALVSAGYDAIEPPVNEEIRAEVAAAQEAGVEKAKDAAAAPRAVDPEAAAKRAAAAEEVAQRKAERAQRDAKIIETFNTIGNARQTAETLGLSQGTVAGVLHRNRESLSVSGLADVQRAMVTAFEEQIGMSVLAVAAILRREARAAAKG